MLRGAASFLPQTSPNIRFSLAMAVLLDLIEVAASVARHRATTKHCCMCSAAYQFMSPQMMVGVPSLMISAMLLVAACSESHGLASRGV